MNERFKELSKQAWDYVQACGRYDKTSTQLFDEKFAELIVRECTKHIEQSIENDEYWSRITGAKSIMAIEEHFGIER